MIEAASVSGGQSYIESARCVASGSSGGGIETCHRFRGEVALGRIRGVAYLEGGRYDDGFTVKRVSGNETTYWWKRRCGDRGGRRYLGGCRLRHGSRKISSERMMEFFRRRKIREMNRLLRLKIGYSFRGAEGVLEDHGEVSTQMGN